MTALTAFADPIAANNFGDTREGGLAGPMGLLIISLLAIGTVLLIRNMNKRLRRLPESFPAPGNEVNRRGGAVTPDTATADTATRNAATRPGAGAAPDAGANRPGSDRSDAPGL
jgi:hypothetical protein